MSVQSSQTTFPQSPPHNLSPFPYTAPSPTPTVDNPSLPTLYVAVCRLCWNDFEDYDSLMAHYSSCQGQEPAGGPIGRWRALRRAFCVKLFNRRYPHIEVPAGYRHLLEDIAVPHHPQHRHNRAPEQCVPESLDVLRQALDALARQFEINTKTLNDTRREIQALVALLPSSTALSVKSAAKMSEVLQGVGGNVSPSPDDTSPGGFRTAVDQIQAVPASQSSESKIAFPPGTSIPIDPHHKPRTSKFHDSGVTGMGSSVSQTLQDPQPLQGYQTVQDFQPSQQFHLLQGSNPLQSPHYLQGPQPLQAASNVVQTLYTGYNRELCLDAKHEILCDCLPCAAVWTFLNSRYPSGIGSESYCPHGTVPIWTVGAAVGERGELFLNPCHGIPCHCPPCVAAWTFLNEKLWSNILS
jgi:hypothetical protein